MSEYLPKSVRDELASAQKARAKKVSRLKVRAGDQEFTILRDWPGGFALDADDVSTLPGRVDLFRGDHHLCEALIVTASEAEGERQFEYKWSTPAGHAPAADYVREDVLRLESQ